MVLAKPAKGPAALMRAVAHDISKPFGCRVTGDVSGEGAPRERGMGDAVTGIKRADSANVKFTLRILRQDHAVCNSNGDLSFSNVRLIASDCSETVSMADKMHRGGCPAYQTPPALTQNFV